MHETQNYGSEDGKAFMSSAVTFSLEPSEVELKRKRAQRSQIKKESSASFQNLHTRSADASASAPKRIKKRKVKKKYLMDAIKAVGKGKVVRLAESKALGCSIMFP